MELADLVRAAQRGDRVATAELYARFHRAVHAVVLAHARYADAADLVQDVFVAALRVNPRIVIHSTLLRYSLCFAIIDRSVATLVI